MVNAERSSITDLSSLLSLWRTVEVVRWQRREVRRSTVQDRVGGGGGEGRVVIGRSTTGNHPPMYILEVSYSPSMAKF